MSHATTTLLTEERYNELRNEGSPRGYSLLSHVFVLLEQAANKTVRSTEATRLYQAFKEAYTWFETNAVIDQSKLDAISLDLINTVETQIENVSTTTTTAGVAPAAPLTTPTTTTTVPTAAAPPAAPAPAVTTTDTTSTDTVVAPTTTAPAPVARSYDRAEGEPDWLGAYDRKVIQPLYERTDNLDSRVKALEDAFPRNREGRFVHYSEWSNHTVNVAGRSIRWAPAIAAFVVVLVLLVLFWTPNAFDKGFLFSLSQGWKWFWSAVVSIIVLILTNRHLFTKTAPAA
jgi:hypothetical protein